MTKVVQPLTSFFPVQELDLATPKPWRRFVPAWLRSLIWVDSIEKYDAFLSYSWKSDGKVAPVIQSVIQKFLCPWYRFRAKSIFRDLSSLPAGSSLQAELCDRLDRSVHLIVLASPEAATSEGMELEARHWFSQPRGGQVLILVSSGEFRTWKESHEYLLPPTLPKNLHTEPLWISLQHRRERMIVTPDDQQLRGELIEDLKQLLLRFYPSHDWDQLRGQERLQRQRARWLVSGIILLLLALLGTAVASWLSAREQRDIAVTRLLASEGYRVAQSEPDRAKVFFLSSLALSETPSALSGLTSLVEQDPHASMKFLGLESQPTALHATDDGRVAIGLPDGSVVLWSIGDSAAAMGERALGAPPETNRLGGLGAPLIAIAQPKDRVLAIDNRGRLIEWIRSNSSPRVMQVLVSNDQEIARRSFDGTFEAAIAEDGEAAAIPTYSGIVIWTQRRGAFQFVRPEMAAGGPVALSADGRRLAYPIGGDLSHKTPMRITNIQDDRLPEVDLPPLPRSTGAVLAASFSRDGATLAVGTQNGFVQVWSVSGTPMANRLLQHRGESHSGGHQVVEHLYLDQSARFLASRYAGGWQVWDIPSGMPLGALRITQASVAAYAGARHSLLTVKGTTIQVHEYGVDHLRYVACMSAPSELSHQEWKELAGDTPRVRACAPSKVR